MKEQEMLQDKKSDQREGGRHMGRHSEDTNYKTRQVEEPWLVKLKINIRREKHHPAILTSGIRLPRWLHYLFRQDTEASERQPARI